MKWPPGSVKVSSSGMTLGSERALRIRASRFESCGGDIICGVVSLSATVAPVLVFALYTTENMPSWWYMAFSYGPIFFPPEAGGECVSGASFTFSSSMASGTLIGKAGCSRLSRSSMAF